MEHAVPTAEHGTMLRRWAATIVAAASLALFAPPLASPARPAEPTLIDQNGHAFSLPQLRDTPLVVTFVAAHCQDACPLINAQTSVAAEHARAAKMHVRFLTISADPEHDSVGDMRHLASIFHAHSDNWLLATGSRANVHAVMRAFHVIAQRGPDGYEDLHTTFVYVVDVHGRVRQTLLASSTMQDDEIAALREHWESLAQ